MQTQSIAELAEKWGMSPRTLRHYCATGRIEGAFLIGKTWHIPLEAKPPKKQNSSQKRSLLSVLLAEKQASIKGGIYHKVQISFTYNSNHIEGSKLSEEQTRHIFETRQIQSTHSLSVDDILECANHFRCIDTILEQAKKPLSEALIKKLHHILKNGTEDSLKDCFAVGDYKKFPNEVGGQITTSPEAVPKAMKKLLAGYHTKKHKNLEDLLEFHHAFECIHPFQDGNGRVGRLILFKECLKHDIVPFLIDESLKLYYYRGLAEWKRERGFLRDTCLAAQDKFKEYLDYFRIDY